MLGAMRVRFQFFNDIGPQYFRTNGDEDVFELRCCSDIYPPVTGGKNATSLPLRKAADSSLMT